MEYLSLYSNLNLKDFCSRLTIIIGMPEFEFDYENETEWGESKNDDLIINVSRPFEMGTLQEWDDTVPDGCNFLISIAKPKIKLGEIEKIGILMTDEYKATVYYHRTWLGPGKNIKREIEIKTSNNKV